MTKFNVTDTRSSVRSPIQTERAPSGQTFEGGAGYARDAKSELFLLAVSNMVGEKTFYESADHRDERFETLVHQVAVADPQWMADFLRWLRGDANMRSASLVGAAEAVKAQLAAEITGGRQIIDSVLQRADEPGELLAYWTSRHGRNIPKPVKRGVGDAVRRLYSERNLLKWDTASHGFRFADVLDIVHPSADPAKPWQGDVFEAALERRHNRDERTPLPMLVANAALRAAAANDPSVLLDADRLARAGMTWEDALSLAGSKVDKAALWSAMIPSMGYMALLRNLRNFDEAGVSDAVALTVAMRLADPAEVAKSRQLPMRFLSAYRAAPSLRWSYPLEQALAHCLGNIPRLGGRTLVLVDTSTSMNGSFSKDGTLMRWDAAVLFGAALASRAASADVVSFSSAQTYYHDAPGAKTKAFDVQQGESLLRTLERWKSGGYFLGGGTDTAGALRKHFAGHTRVIIVTDEQASQNGGEVSQAIPANVPLYTWNLAGYQHGHAPSGSGQRHTFGGLTDQAFRMIPLLESGRDGAYPWMTKD